MNETEQDILQVIVSRALVAAIIERDKEIERLRHVIAEGLDDLAKRCNLLGWTAMVEAGAIEAKPER